jgi:hypothetical protein
MDEGEAQVLLHVRDRRGRQGDGRRDATQIASNLRDGEK